MIDYLPSLTTLIAFAAASAVLALTPGPDMTLFLSKTVGQSRAAGLASLAGATTGVLVHSLLVALGLSALIAASATAFTVLKVVGAGYLAWLAFDAIRNGSSFRLDRPAAKDPLGRVFMKGVMIDLLNPKVVVFFVTFLPQFVSPQEAHVGVKLFVLGAVCSVLCFLICVPLILAAERIAGLLKSSRRATRVIDYLFATVFGAFAVKLALTQGRS